MLAEQTPPRVHAFKILRMDLHADRKKYLENNVPEKYVEMVKTHVLNLWKYRHNIDKTQRK